MADLLQIISEALQTYWSSPLSLAVLAVCGASIGTLLYVFVTNARNAKLRVSLLTGLYALSIFFWAFIAASLVLCISQARMVAYARFGVPLAVFGAVCGGLATSTVISFLVWRYGNKAVLRKFSMRELRPSEAWVGEYVGLLARFEEVPGVRVRLVESDEALAMAIGGEETHVLILRGLMAPLYRGEIETGIAHQVMHPKHNNAQIKSFSQLFSRVLFFEPLIQFFYPPVRPETE